MEKRFTILDERGAWHKAACAAASLRGYETHTIARGEHAKPGGLGFIRPHAIPSVLKRNQLDYQFMSERLTMVQDRSQVDLYEDKSAQFWRFGQFMPPTWRFDNREQAVEFAKREAQFPIVSKADVGASSKNVRIIPNRMALLAHIQEIWKHGIVVDHCAGGGSSGRQALSRQKGYVLLQQFIPHTVTWRVNRIGNCYAIFKRFNGKDGKAQTGNVEPVMQLDETMVSLLGFAKQVSDAIRSKWVALDILTSVSGWRLLETSLAWPWPSPGDCMGAPFFGDTTRVWYDIWNLMLDEYERGVFDEKPVEAHV